MTLHHRTPGWRSWIGADGTDGLHDLVQEDVGADDSRGAAAFLHRIGEGHDQALGGRIGVWVGQDDFTFAAADWYQGREVGS